jgi:hypothetical protein
VFTLTGHITQVMLCLVIKKTNTFDLYKFIHNRIHKERVHKSLKINHNHNVTAALKDFLEI